MRRSCIVLWILRGLTGLAIFVSGLVVLGVLGIVVPRGPSDTAYADVAVSGADRTILLLANPIHTDIALPATPDVLKAFGFVSSGGLELDYPGVKVGDIRLGVAPFLRGNAPLGGSQARTGGCRTHVRQFGDACCPGGIYRPRGSGCSQPDPVCRWLPETDRCDQAGLCP